MTHLTADELVDALEATLALDRQAHLLSCEHCREQQALLASLFTEVRGVEIPDPSPLFWDHLSDNVRRIVAADRPSPPRLARWFQWPVLVPLGALAVLVFVLVSAVPHGTDEVQGPQSAMNRGTDVIDVDAAVDPDEHWELMAALVGDVDFDAADEAGITGTPGTADEVVLTLTSAEQQELVRLLRQELERSGG